MSDLLSRDAFNAVGSAPDFQSRDQLAKDFSTVAHSAPAAKPQAAPVSFAGGTSQSGSTANYVASHVNRPVIKPAQQLASPPQRPAAPPEQAGGRPCRGCGSCSIM
eukprot:TRINITY_DN1725_c0_g1_i1.p1 TRINITY_DN1725_c0_g1~~TRINITY_DN1725_c0_g1_i1.p1  ORF type:complete len:106 (-),score=11.18 TRINITY_DN1725_c0_g1_i1:336-653(-)